MIDFEKRISKNRMREFADFMLGLSEQVGFKVSSRGWAYIMEPYGFVTKDQFDKIEGIINRCRKQGYLPVDFTADESAREFKEIHKPTESTMEAFIYGWLKAAYECEKHFAPDWWEGEEYYIQMIVEKVDLVTLFQPICRAYHIPIANAKGWSSIYQRADYARRFKEAEGKGLKCVLLYCGDHDPDGLRISETLRRNIEDVSAVRWVDGEIGYDPSNLIIDRFGLNYDFIIRNELTWIDNLVTGGGELAMMKDGEIVQGFTKKGRPHPNFHLEYLQDYLRDVGVRKCEANALVTAPEEGRKLCLEAITKYLGSGALARFEAKKEKVEQAVLDVKYKYGIDDFLESALENLEDT